jgi:hypothetical protein
VEEETAPEPDPVATRHDAGGFGTKTDLHWREIGRLVPDEGSAFPSGCPGLPPFSSCRQGQDFLAQSASLHPAQPTSMSSPTTPIRMGMT